MRIITAIGNPYLNEKLKSYKECEVIGKDIQYQEGIIEMLEVIRDVDFLIISNNLEEEYSFKTIINKVLEKENNIKIIAFLKNEDTDIEQFLNSKKIYKIYYLNKDGYQEFLNKFIKNTSKNNEEITEEINNLKNIILENNSIKIENKKINEHKLILIDGNRGEGKTCLGIILSKYIGNLNKKVLLIEFNNEINMIIRNKNYDKFHFKNIEINMKNIELNEWLLSDFKQILKKIKSYEISGIIEKMKELFEYIILDFSKEIEFKNEEIFCKKANKIFFVMESNLLSINKATENFERYINDYKIEKEKIKIILNKINKYSISKEEVQENYYKIFIINEILYDEKYTLFINNNFQDIVNIESFEKIFKEI